MQKRGAQQRLVTRLKRRDDTALVDLARSYWSKIYQLALRYMKTPEDAEEVAQDVLLRVHQKIDSFREEAALSSWIYRITSNTAMSRLRSARQTRPHEVRRADLAPWSEGDATRAAGTDPADWSSLADDALYRSELRTRLVEALMELPEIYRAPVLLRDVQGLSTEETSAAIGVKPQTVKSRLHRGRLILRRRLSEFSSGLGLHRHAA